MFDDSVLTKNRDYLWDINVDVQHEISRGLSVNASYNHNRDGSFTVTENTLVGPENFDEFCITLPNDPRLANAGQRQCGYYDVQREYFARGTLRVTNAREFVGKNGNTKLPQRYWDGFTVGANGRLPLGATIGGGLDFWPSGSTITASRWTPRTSRATSPDRPASRPGTLFSRRERTCAAS